ncbi:MAG: EamA family transporter [Hahellaceae bacterium]|nr:EamA family transporter [Hahellaceae bacterium]MCP5169391.1 EamA family transporter [Hahellaceae bacterium]
MSVPAAYAAVVVVWATTPLGVIWSSETVHPVLAALMRMALAAALGLALLKWRGIEFPWHAKALRVYVVSCLGIFGGMICTYLSAPYLSSGMVSVMYGLTPIFSGLLAMLLLQNQRFGLFQWLATLVSLSGLIIVCSNNLVIKDERAVLLLLSGVLLFSLSGVMVKREGSEVHPFAVTIGAITVSLPAYFLVWMLMDGGHLDSEQWSSKSLYAILYLAIFGSLIGFFSYFYVLRHLPPSTVALVTLITPVFAIAMGHLLNHEILAPSLLYGGALVLFGLVIYFWGERVVRVVRMR